ncbi:MAG: DNA polymerase I [Minicystis sp.]
MSSRPTVLPPAGAADVLYLIDFSGYVFRAYHAMPALSSPQGEPTHATYGTVTLLQQLIDQRKPVYLGVVMDPPGPRKRAEIDARYKAHRPPPPEDLVIQMARSREFVEAYRIPVFIAEGHEADDLMAVAVAKARAKGLRVVIASSDKDLMQLVDDEHVMLWDAMRDKVYGAPEVTAKFGVPPAQLRDLLALVGDTSDNVPGVPGVGPKTAADLLAQFGTLEGIYQHLDEVKKPKIRESLKEHEADARISQELVTLRTDGDVQLDLEALRYGSPDNERLRALFGELGFNRFLKALPAPAQKPVELSASYPTLLDRKALDAFVTQARADGRLSVAVFGTSPEPVRAHITGIALASAPGHAAYLPMGHRYLGAPKQLGLDEVRAALGPIVEAPTISKIGHDLKYSEVALARHGMALAGATMDTMLASYLLDPEAENTLEAVAEREAGVKLPPLEALGPKKRGQPARTFEEIEVGEAASHAGRFAEVALLLEGRYQPRLTADRLDGLLAELELPLSHVLAGMEHVGVLIDPGALDDIGREMAKELAVLEQKAYEAAGQELNLGSPKQLETVLFDTLGLKSIKKTRTGRSTDAEVLEALADEHPLPGLVLEHRAIAKLKGTYVDALPKLVHPDTGRIHTRWSQAVAATGRISSQDPNLQNIPIRTALGKSIRRAFVAPPGHLLVSADYSQIELRVLAHLSQDPVLVDAFNNKQDVHVRTAMEIFGVTKDGVTEEMRRRSKTINFGVIYGMGESALAKRLGITRVEAAKFIDAYFERYKGVHAFMEKTMVEARRTEVVRTLFGRKRNVSELRSTDRMRRAYAERIAQNTPIQGTAADLLKMAMVKLAANPVTPGARMVLTVHDELVFEVPKAEVEDAKKRIQDVMEKVHPFDVPLVVDVGAGATWADAK